MMPKNLQKLITLIKNSSSLSEDDKTRLINSLNILSTDELETLEKTLEHEADKRKAINHQRNQKIRALNEEYENVIQNFKHKDLPKILAEAEKTVQTEENDKAEQLIDRL